MDKHLGNDFRKICGEENVSVPLQQAVKASEATAATLAIQLTCPKTLASQQCSSQHTRKTILVHVTNRECCTTPVCTWPRPLRILFLRSLQSPVIAECACPFVTSSQTWELNTKLVAQGDGLVREVLLEVASAPTLLLK